MEHFKKNVIAWSKLSAIGARPLAESVGIDRDVYARVLNNRRDLPEGSAVALGRALGLNEHGFVPCLMQSNLCRNLEDLNALEELGFKVKYLAQVKTEKEFRGGSSLQKYVAIYFSYDGAGRISIMRMATEKWLRLTENLGHPKLPELTVDTLVMPHFNAISQEVSAKSWEQLIYLLDINDEGNLVRWIREQLNCWLESEGPQIKAQNFSKKIIRKTHLIRLTEKNSTLVDWPVAARDLAATHFLVPLTTEFLPIKAVGLRNDKTRVFVYITVLNKKENLKLPRNLEQPVDHALIFMRTDEGDLESHELIFDGPVSNLLDLGGRSIVHGLRNDPDKLDTTTIFFTNKLVDPRVRLMTRADLDKLG